MDHTCSRRKTLKLTAIIERKDDGYVARCPILSSQTKVIAGRVHDDLEYKHELWDRLATAFCIILVHMFFGIGGPLLATSSLGAATDIEVSAPVATSTGQIIKVVHGYNDPLPNESCKIGSALDHCNNQRYGLDLEPSNQTDKDILAPMPGVVAWSLGDCLGLKTRDNLNLNICHFSSFKVAVGNDVPRNTVLGQRSTPWIHLSLDDRYNNSTSKPAVPFNGSHRFEGQSLDSDGSRNQHAGKVFTLPTLRDRIYDSLRQAQASSPPLYMLDQNSFTSGVTMVWLDFTSWLTGSGLTQKYDELYQTGLDYHSLRINALIKAINLLNTDSLLSEKYLARSYLFAKLSNDSFSAASEVFLDNVTVAEILAQGIKNGCEASVKFGLNVTDPATAKVADWAYIISDYAVDRAITGTEVANKNLLVSLFTKGLFEGVPFNYLGGKTIADYTRNRIGKSVFPVLAQLTKEEEWQRAAIKIIKESGVMLSTTTVEAILNYLSDNPDKILPPVRLRIDVF